MVNFLRYFGQGTLICCIFWIFWPAESKTISQKVGDEVILNCTNTRVNIVTWKMNGHLLIALKLENKTFHKNEKANRLDVEMLSTKSQLYALVIKNTQKSHEGNYTCEMATDSGLFEKKWELHVTDIENFHGRNSTEEAEIFPIIAIAAAVPSACILIIIIVLITLKCVQKRRKNSNRPPVSIRQQQPEDIYENHLEIQRQAQAYHYKPRS